MSISIGQEGSTSTSSPGFTPWFLSWMIIIAAFWGLSKSRWGHTVLYGLLWATVAILVITHASDIQNLFIQGGLLTGQAGYPIPTGPPLQKI